MMRFSLLAAVLAAMAPLSAGAAPDSSRPSRSAQPVEESTDDDGAELKPDEPADQTADQSEEPADEPGDESTDEVDESTDEADEPTGDKPAVDAADKVEKAKKLDPSAATGNVPGLPPEDVQSFADATLDATPLHFAFNAFGDVSVAGRSPSVGDESATFSLGTFALLINGELAKSLVGTAEMAFEVRDDNEQEVSLERLHLRWQTPRFFLVGGRTHTDIGYWNTAFHHGAWLHLPIARPRALRGEDAGGILPVHWIGVEGGVRLGGPSGAFNLGAGVGNGRGHDEESIPLRKDTNNFKAVKVKIEYHGLFLPDLRVGVGGVYDPIAPEPMEVRPALPDARMDEYIGNVFAAYRGAHLTLIAEAYSIWHRAEVETFNTTDAFIVLGYRVGRLTPYLQLERMDENGNPDPFYTPFPGMPTPSTPIDQTEVLIGARFDPSVWSALKFEYRHTRVDAADGPDHSLSVNWSFGI